MRVVLDTNTTIAALLWRGTAHRMLLAARLRGARLFVSPFLLDELSTVLTRNKFDKIFAQRKTSRALLLQHYESLVTVVRPTFLPDAVPDDPVDNHVLACAVKARAEFILSGDKHLRDLNPYQQIEIINAGAFLLRIPSL